jgi:hypothetical protein
MRFERECRCCDFVVLTLVFRLLSRCIVCVVAVVVMRFRGQHCRVPLFRCGDVWWRLCLWDSSFVVVVVDVVICDVCVVAVVVMVFGG